MKISRSVKNATNFTERRVGNSLSTVWAKNAYFINHSIDTVRHQKWNQNVLIEFLRMKFRFRFYELVLWISVQISSIVLYSRKSNSDRHIFRPNISLIIAKISSPLLNCECWYSLMHVFKLGTILELSAVSNLHCGSLQRWTPVLLTAIRICFVAFASLGIGLRLERADLFLGLVLGLVTAAVLTTTLVQTTWIPSHCDIACCLGPSLALLHTLAIRILANKSLTSVSDLIDEFTSTESVGSA